MFLTLVNAQLSVRCMVRSRWCQKQYLGEHFDPSRSDDPISHWKSNHFIISKASVECVPWFFEMAIERFGLEKLRHTCIWMNIYSWKAFTLSTHSEKLLHFLAITWILLPHLLYLGLWCEKHCLQCNASSHPFDVLAILVGFALPCHEILSKKWPKWRAYDIISFTIERIFE